MNPQLNTINEGQAFKNWSKRITEATDVVDPEKLKYMSNLCAIKERLESNKSLLTENYTAETPQNITGIGATTWPSAPGTGVGALPSPFYQTGYQTGSGDIPSVTLSVAMNVAAYTIGLELLPFINMDMPSTMLSYLEAVYGGGELDETGTSPIYFQLKNTGITQAWKTVADLTKGDVVYVAKQTADALVASIAIKCIYMQDHRHSQAIIVKAVSVGDITALGAYTANDAYSEVDVIEEITASAGLFIEDAANTADTTSNSFVDPLTIDYVGAQDQFVMGIGHNDGISESPMPRAIAENGSSNTVNLRMFSTSVEAQASEVIASVERIQEGHLKAYGHNPMANLYQAAQDQLTQTINRQILNDFFRLGVTNAAQLKAAQNLDLNLYVAPASSTDKDLADFGIAEFKDILGVDRSAEFASVKNSEANSAAENSPSRQRKIRSTILAMSNIINTVGRRGPGDVCVVNSQIATAIQDLPQGWTQAPDTSVLVSNPQNLYFIGTVAGVKVFCDPSMKWEDTRIAVGRKGDANSPGMKFCAYDLADSIEVVPEGTMGKKISILSQYNIVHAGFYPELQYLTVGLDTDFNNWI